MSRTYIVEDMEHNAYVVQALNPIDAAWRSVRLGCTVVFSHRSQGHDGVWTWWFKEIDELDEHVDDMMVEFFFYGPRRPKPPLGFMNDDDPWLRLQAPGTRAI